MGIYRHTLILEGPGHGASESLYYDIPSPSSVSLAFTTLSDVKNKRALLLGKEWQVKGERIQQVIDDAGVKQRGVGSMNKFFLPGVQAQPAAETNISLQVLFADATQAHKKLMFMAGCPRSLFPNADALDLNQSTLPGQWLSSFNGWRNLIRSLGAGWYSAPMAQNAPIVGYDVDPVTGITTYTLGASITWPNNNKPVKVSVEFPTVRSPLDGVQLVIHTSDTVCYTAKPRPAAAFTVQGILNLKGASLIKLSTANQQGQMGSVTPMNPMSRKRGRPLLVSRGRLPVVVRW